MSGKWISTLKNWWPLFLISSLSLFFELAVIRWLSGEIRIFAYFQNLALLAAFLGLAIGFGLVGKGRGNKFAFPALWGVFVVLVLAVNKVDESKPIFNPASEDIFFWNTASAPFWSSLVIFLAFLIIFFLISMFLFIPLGQATGTEMALHPPIQAYIINIAASLVGIWIFTLCSSFHTPPPVWFGIGLVGMSVYYLYQKKLSRFILAIYILTMIGIAVLGQGKVWSPYNRLNLQTLTYTPGEGGGPIKVGYLLNVQQTF